MVVREECGGGKTVFAWGRVEGGGGRISIKKHEGTHDDLKRQETKSEENTTITKAAGL